MAAEYAITISCAYVYHYAVYFDIIYKENWVLHIFGWQNIFRVFLGTKQKKVISKTKSGCFNKMVSFVELLYGCTHGSDSIYDLLTLVWGVHV